MYILCVPIAIAVEHKLQIAHVSSELQTIILCCMVNYVCVHVSKATTIKLAKTSNTLET